MEKTLGELKPNPKNPRKITDEKLASLENALAEFGDLSGVVYNVQTERLVGGHQRAKVIPPSAKVVIAKRYAAPTKKGTIAVGYVLYRGERFAYREVDWTETKEKAANIAANRGAGEWDEKELSAWLRDLDADGYDLDLTMFDASEREDFMVPTREPNFEEGSEGDQGQLDQKKRVECPDCGHLFVPGWK